MYIGLWLACMRTITITGDSGVTRGITHDMLCMSGMRRYVVAWWHLGVLRFVCFSRRIYMCVLVRACLWVCEAAVW